MQGQEIRTLVQRLLAKWPYFLLSLAIAMSMAYLYLWSTPKKYLITTSIQLKDHTISEKSVSQEEFLNGVQLLNFEPELEDEIGILTSYSTIAQSLRNLQSELQIVKYPAPLGIPLRAFSKPSFPTPFDVQIDAKRWQMLNVDIDIDMVDTNNVRISARTKDQFEVYRIEDMRSRIESGPFSIDTVLKSGDLLITPYLSLSIKGFGSKLISGNNRYSIKLRTLDEAAKEMEKKIATMPISAKSSIVRINVVSATPEYDLEALRNLCEVYVYNDLAKKNELGQRTIAFIDSQLNGIGDSLENNESSLEAFRNSSNMIDVETTSQSLDTKLTELEGQQSSLSVQNKYYKYIAASLAKDDVTNILSPSSAGIQDQLLSSLILQLSVLSQDKISRGYNSKASNPAYQVLEKKIEVTKKSLRESIQNLIGANEIALEGLHNRITETKMAIGQLPSNERSLTDIQRKFEFNDNIYGYLLQKKAEAGIAIASNVADKRIIDVPRLVRKIGPNGMLIFLVAICSGLLIPAGLIFANDFINPKVEHVGQLSAITHLPILESVAYADPDNKSSQSNEYTYNSFRYVRQQIINLKKTRSVKMIGITSASSGEGKTFASFNLAITLAKANQKVLIVDLDLHQRKITRQFNADASPGIVDFLTGGETQVIQKTRIEGIDIIPAGIDCENPSDLLSEQRLETLFLNVREKYDCIIFDTPPIGAIPDYLSISALLDYTILVVRNEFSRKEAVIRTDKIISDHSLSAGIIYNGTRAKGYYYQSYS